MVVEGEENCLGLLLALLRFRLRAQTLILLGTTKATGLKFFTNLAQVSDALVSRVKSLKRPLLKGEIGVEEPKNRSCKYISVCPSLWFNCECFNSLSGTHNSCVDNYVDGANDENSDDVPLQFKPFAGEYCRYAISPELASAKFQSVGLLLGALNGIFNTNIPISYPGIQKTLDYLLNNGYDLGIVYAHLQVVWPTLSVPSISTKPSSDDDNSPYNIGSPELVSRKFQDIDELLSFLNMSFDTQIPRSKAGVEKVLGFLVDQGHKFGDICAHMAKDTGTGEGMVRSLEIGSV